MKSQRTLSGLTLVELMVALLLSLVLMGALIQMFVANKKTYQLTNELARIQENARYAASLLESSIRMAGFLGCSGRNRQIVHHLAHVPPTFTPENGIEGWESSSIDTSHGQYTILANAPVSDASGHLATAGIHLDNNTMAVANSDVLRVWHIEGDAVNGQLSATNFTHAIKPAYQDNDMAMLTHCTGVDIVKVCPASGSRTTDFSCPDNTSSQYVNTGLSGIQAYKLSGWLYYIGKRGHRAANPPTLYRKAISKNALIEAAQELVEGVESMQLLYGEDTDPEPDGAANRYVDARQVSDWKKVVSVHVALLVQGERNDLLDGAQTVIFNGATVTSNDGRLRYPFTTTVALRNRAP